MEGARCCATCHLGVKGMSERVSDFKHRTPKQNTPSWKSFLEKELADQIRKHLFRKGFQSAVHLEYLFRGFKKFLPKISLQTFAYSITKTSCNIYHSYAMKRLFFLQTRRHR